MCVAKSAIGATTIYFIHSPNWLAGGGKGLHRHDKFGVARLVAVLSHALRLEKHNLKKPRCYGIFETGGVRILKRG